MTPLIHTRRYGISRLNPVGFRPSEHTVPLLANTFLDNPPAPAAPAQTQTQQPTTDETDQLPAPQNGASSQTLPLAPLANTTAAPAAPIINPDMIVRVRHMQGVSDVIDDSFHKTFDEIERVAEVMSLSALAALLSIVCTMFLGIVCAVQAYLLRSVLGDDAYYTIVGVCAMVSFISAFGLVVMLRPELTNWGSERKEAKVAAKTAE